MRRMNKRSVSVLLIFCLITAAVSGGCAGKSEGISGGQGADGRKSGITAPAGSEVITGISGSKMRFGLPASGISGRSLTRSEQS